MKKFISFAAYALMLVAATTMFSACGDDDDDIVPPPTEDVHQYVDLGLPSGLKWADRNVGAAQPEAYGFYFAWGETQAKNDYKWATYKWGTSYQALTKYCGRSDYGKDGYTDALTELELSDDAARANWGGQWRLPSETDFRELINNTTHTWVDDYEGTGISGYKFTSNSDLTKSIFLPSANCRGVTPDGVVGDYWARSYNQTEPDRAVYLFFKSSELLVYNNGWRFVGCTVRPVRP